jgi:alkylhydroperoxidase/carboxymuconolactone decarboxylase family protein YurZ
MTPDHRGFLRRLAIHDEATTAGALDRECSLFGLDARTFALARVAALIATESSMATLQWTVDRALAAGASEENIIDTLVAAAPIVGMARVTAAAPEVALALGYDVDGED